MPRRAGRSPGVERDVRGSSEFDWNDAYLGDGSDPLVANRRLLAAAPSVPGRALDLGCGTGGNAMALAEEGWDVTGVDIASRAIASARIAARRRGAEVRFEVADVTTWVPTGDYDFVLLTWPRWVAIYAVSRRFRSSGHGFGTHTATTRRTMSGLPAPLITGPSSESVSVPGAGAPEHRPLDRGQSRGA